MLWLQPLPDDDYERRESVELAFVAALQHLPPNQRAALILRDVLGFTAQEVADAMATSEASVKSALQRARSAMEERVPDRTQQSTLGALGDARIREIVQSYTDALESGDVTPPSICRPRRPPGRCPRTRCGSPDWTPSRRSWRPPR